MSLLFTPPSLDLLLEVHCSDLNYGPLLRVNSPSHGIFFRYGMVVHWTGFPFICGQRQSWRPQIKRESIVWPWNRLRNQKVLVSTVNSCSTFLILNLMSAGCEILIGIQEQIAASHEFDGVRKEKERLTAAALIISWFQRLISGMVVHWTGFPFICGQRQSWRPQIKRESIECPNSLVALGIASSRLTVDLWLAKDNRFLIPKSSYGRIIRWRTSA